MLRYKKSTLTSVGENVFGKKRGDLGTVKMMKSAMGEGRVGKFE